jgi:hypothetical protein
LTGATASAHHGKTRRENDFSASVNFDIPRGGFIIGGKNSRCCDFPVGSAADRMMARSFLIAQTGALLDR